MKEGRTAAGAYARAPAADDGIAHLPLEPMEMECADSGDDGGPGDSLANGKPVDIWHRKHMGYLAQYFAVGLIKGAFPATIYGLFLGYLHVPSYVYATAGTITTLPWSSNCTATHCNTNRLVGRRSFKFFFGAVNDCVPIFGYRRKPYMVLGWTVCALTLLVLGSVPLPAPYWCEGRRGECICNEPASREGGKYALLMSMAALGYVVADVAADGLTVEYARREPELQRGQIQTTVYYIRTWGQILSYVIVGLCLNGKDYNGTFDWSLSFPQVCLLFALPAAVMVPLSWYCVHEDPVTQVPLRITHRRRTRGHGRDGHGRLRTRHSLLSFQRAHTHTHTHTQTVLIQTALIQTALILTAACRCPLCASICAASGP